MIPLSLYIHIPWCLRKCPYCDFNAHQKSSTIPEDAYYTALLNDLQQDLQNYPLINDRQIISIFFGGGTPSLLSGKFYYNLLQELNKLLPLSKDIEITLEVNPNTIEINRFIEYKSAGINRLSLGIQSFNPQNLKNLGRTHDDKQAHHAIITAYNAGFNNINLDIMYGLTNQTITDGISDLKIALNYNVEHISWYQLTLEPNTIFYKYQPMLPTDDICERMEQQGIDELLNNNYNHYEISAFSKPTKESRHNLNYWLFGDYYGIGAGAHGKLTNLLNYQITRTQKYRQPKDYLDLNKNFITTQNINTTHETIFEFIVNTTRLQKKIPLNLFTQTTGIDTKILIPTLKLAQNMKFIELNNEYWQVTEFGRRFTNDLQTLFL